MKTYTIQELKELPIQIECTSVEQANKIWKANGEKSFWNVGNGYFKFYVKCNKKSYPTWMGDPYYFQNVNKVKETIEFSQIDFQEKDLLKELVIW